MRFFVISIVLASLGCASTPKEAAPLDIVRTPPKAKPRPLVVQRRVLNEVLKHGPGRFLQKMPVQPARIKGQFVGFQVLSLYSGRAAHPEGVHIGDIVTAVNGVNIRRPDHLMKVWTNLRTARSIRVDLVRKHRPLRITYRIIN